MAKFFGAIGYGFSTEKAPGVYDDTIVERKYYGDVTRDSRRLSETDRVNGDISTSNSISIVADAYAYENFFAMRYISWMGTRWTVQYVEVNRPRLIMTLGGEYNGPTAPASDSA